MPDSNLQPVSIATPAERAWERLRLAIERTLESRTDQDRDEISHLKRDFLAALAE